MDVVVDVGDGHFSWFRVEFDAGLSDGYSGRARDTGGYSGAG